MKKWMSLTVLLAVLSIVFVPHASLAQTVEQEEISADISPEEIAEELGLPEADDFIAPLSVEELTARSGVDIIREWPIVIWVNKAARGSTAQRLRVYKNGRLVLETKTSTGREQWERAKSGRKYFSGTPTGWFNPTRLVKDYFSNTWLTKMPYAIFFNGGIAVHAAAETYYNKLGTRASGGCVRLRYDEAQWLFNLVRNEPQSLVPIFRRNGAISRDSRGRLRKRQGPSTLIIVEDKRRN
ncbi:MAG: L,D-transpeptidase [Pseudobdellovibrionaceae bacterium]